MFQNIYGGNDMGPLITVVIPIYNTEKYLTECVDSVRKQTYTNIEIILVDDGSPDRAPILCDEYAAVDSRIRVIHKKNGGLSSARNAGIKEANGSFVTFVDSDDVVHARMIEKMYLLHEKYDADIVKIGLLETTVAKHEETASTEIVVDPITAMNRIYTDKPEIVCACGKLFKIELFQHLLFPEGIIHEDEFLMPKLFHRANKIVLSDEILYYYMQRENGSIMRSPFTKKRMDVLYVMEERSATYLEWGYTELYRKSIIDYYYHLRRLYRLTETFEEEHRTIVTKLGALNPKMLTLRERLGRRKMLKAEKWKRC